MAARWGEVARAACFAAVLGFAAGCGGSSAGAADAGVDRAVVDAADGAAPGDAAPAPLTVFSARPAGGSLWGGTSVVIAGSGFTTGATVLFGDAAALDATLLSPYLLRVVAPAGATPGWVPVTVRMPDGRSATAPAAYEYRGTSPTGVDWCSLHSPADVTISPGVNATLFGRVWELGCRWGDSSCPDILGEVGYGDPAVDPSATPNAYVWSTASYNPSHASDEEYEFVGSPSWYPGPVPGTYATVFRVTIDGGNTWTYCDQDGSGNGFQVQQMGRLTVADDAVHIHSCFIASPATTASIPGGATRPISGQVMVTPCPASGEAPVASITAELGVGPAGTDPVAVPAAYTWVTAAPTPGSGSECTFVGYEATVTVPDPGSYTYWYRFSVDDGLSWTYCDLINWVSGLESAQAGHLTVGPPQVDWCRLEYPLAISVPPGVETGVYGRVRVAGCTGGAVPCPGVVGQVGHGDPGVSPAVVPDAYVWTDAEPSASQPGDGDDEVVARIREDSAGTYAYAYRFSRDGGHTWIYCGRDGSGAGFDPARMSTLTVAPGQLAVSTCSLEARWTYDSNWTPAATPVLFDSLFFSVGCSAPCPTISGQIGYGPAIGDPLATPDAFVWVEAAPVGASYQAMIAPAAGATYLVAARFTADGGATWTYCDQDGSANGLQRDQFIRLTVGALPIDWCRLDTAQTTATAGVKSGVLRGLVYVAGCTEGPERCRVTTAAVGFGDPGVDPALVPDSYSWTPASFDFTRPWDSLDGYAAQVIPPAPGTFATVVRFSTDQGATWTYCDTAGGASFSLARAGVLTVTAP